MWPYGAGDEDDVSPALTWSGAPKSTETFVLIADESGGSAVAPTTNWLVYDIPSSVVELREELSGGGASDVARLGMKDDAGTEPIVVDPMEGMMGGMGGMEGYEDPEIADMRRMISGAVDSGFDPSARAKEGRRRDGQTGYKVSASLNSITPWPYPPNPCTCLLLTGM
ncbi:hypothetical protein T492DRAFT_923006 [Pavlovales sp. CCMP2436]|nr:hypothetical protein T492DRAFT_923006 [Pavlovales sp. CCMP2436]